MFGQPMFDLRDAAGVMGDLEVARKTFPDHYIKLNAFDSTLGFETVRLSFIVNRPSREPGFALERVGHVGFPTAVDRLVQHFLGRDLGKRERLPL